MLTYWLGNDVNYDGGYGEDNDFGFSLVKAGVTVCKILIQLICI
jgi:hypothetical protein